MYGTRLKMSPASYISLIFLQLLIVTLLFCAIDGRGKFIRRCRHVSQIIIIIHINAVYLLK